MRANTKIASSALLLVLFVTLTASSCKKKEKEKEPTQYGSVTDVDGNTYKTVKIGSQWWMAENLKTKHYRNGLPLFTVLPTDPDTTWANTRKGAYCKYFNDDNNVPQYGLLYNWNAVNDTSKIAPAGWHVPTDAEWQQLETYLGMSQSAGVNWRGSNEGDKMKIASPTGWITYGSIWSTNESGFAAQAGSCRLFNGTWGDPGVQAMGFWWSSSLRLPSNEPWYRYLDYKKSNVFRYYGPKNYGMSIRCVKD